jgi:hypothetical protein
VIESTKDYYQDNDDEYKYSFQYENKNIPDIKVGCHGNKNNTLKNH